MKRKVLFGFKFNTLIFLVMYFVDIQNGNIARPPLATFWLAAILICIIVDDYIHQKKTVKYNLSVQQEDKNNSVHLCYICTNQAIDQCRHCKVGMCELHFSFRRIYNPFLKSSINIPVCKHDRHHTYEYDIDRDKYVVVPEPTTTHLDPSMIPN